MPFKDPQKKKEYTKRKYQELKGTPLGKFKQHKERARGSKIPFLLSFDEWWKLWQDSGHWEERGKGTDKYQMCRLGDEGPYSIDNVYIATTQVNGRDAWFNGKTQHLPEPKLSKEQKLEIYNHPYVRGDGVKLAKLFNVATSTISLIRRRARSYANCSYS